MVKGELLANRIRMKILISAIRDSHPDISYLYLKGQCYNFANILRTQFPGGDFWYSYIEGHMYYHYYGRWYDIRGEHLKQPNGSEKYVFQYPDPAHRWGKRDRRRLIDTSTLMEKKNEIE